MCTVLESARVFCSSLLCITQQNLKIRNEILCTLVHHTHARTHAFRTLITIALQGFIRFSCFITLAFTTIIILIILGAYYMSGTVLRGRQTLFNSILNNTELQRVIFLGLNILSFVYGPVTRDRLGANVKYICIQSQISKMLNLSHSSLAIYELQLAAQ